MAITLTSTLQDILNQFVILDAGHAASAATIQTDDTSIELFWPDTSRVQLEISAMGVGTAGVDMAPAIPINEPGGTNPNNPELAPAPVLTTLAPATIASGGTGFLLTITGTGFVDGSQVTFGSAVGNATYVSPTQVTFQVGPDGYAAPGTVQVTVQSPGGAASNALPFTIT